MSYQEQDALTQQSGLPDQAAKPGQSKLPTPPAHPLSWMSSSAQMAGNYAKQSLPLGGPATAGEGSDALKSAPFAGMYDVNSTAKKSPAAAGPSGPATAPKSGAPIAGGGDKPADGYQAPYASVYLTGITEGTTAAHGDAKHVTGQDSAVALYEGTRPSGKGDPNADKTDQVDDLLGVTQFARMGDKVQVDKDGKLNLDKKALSEKVSIGGADGEQYMSPLDIGSKGAQEAIQSNPTLAKQMKQGADPHTHPELAKQFISITGHSGGGQSSFYTAIELYQRGFRNISVVGYDMAISPHEREVMEKLGIQVTNVTGHTGNKDNYANSPVGEGIRLGMGGDLKYFDASVDRGGGENVLQQHGVSNNDRVTVMLRWSAWLDSIGKHQQFTSENYQAFEKATGGKGDQVAGPDGKQHQADSPLSGSFVNTKDKKDETYLRTPEWNGGDLINGISKIPLVGDKLGKAADKTLTGLVPDFKDTRLPHLDAGIHSNVQAQGSGNLQQGAAQGSVNLSGSSIDVAGAHLTAGQWAQASGGVNLSQGTANLNVGGQNGLTGGANLGQGAANLNVGGQNGVGANVNLSQGQIDVNAFGHHVDVAQGIRNTGQAAKQEAGKLGQGIKNGWNWLTGH